MYSTASTLTDALLGDVVVFGTIYGSNEILSHQLQTILSTVLLIFDLRAVHVRRRKLAPLPVEHGW